MENGAENGARGLWILNLVLNSGYAMLRPISEAAFVPDLSFLTAPPTGPAPCMRTCAACACPERTWDWPRRDGKQEHEFARTGKYIGITICSRHAHFLRLDSPGVELPAEACISTLSVDPLHPELKLKWSSRGAMRRLRGEERETDFRESSDAGRKDAPTVQMQYECSRQTRTSGQANFTSPTLGRQVLGDATRRSDGRRGTGSRSRAQGRRRDVSPWGVRACVLQRSCVCSLFIQERARDGRYVYVCDLILRAWPPSDGRYLHLAGRRRPNALGVELEGALRFLGEQIAVCLVGWVSSAIPFVG